MIPVIHNQCCNSSINVATRMFCRQSGREGRWGTETSRQTAHRRYKY
ncbi:MAG: hypothetical protein J6Y33_08660 [Prevotella sp.]|nr:hypothetical protein [Prevotella sp.]